MDANTKKTTLRMIPYGMYVLTAEKEGFSVRRLVSSARTGCQLDGGRGAADACSALTADRARTLPSTSGAGMGVQTPRR